VFYDTNLSLIKSVKVKSNLQDTENPEGYQKKNIMNKIVIILTFFLSVSAISQVRIGATNSVTDVSSTSVLLEFGTDGDKGIILPYIETVPTGANNAKGGTIIFDVSANTEYKVKIKNENAGWTDLSRISGYSQAVESVVKVPQALPLADQTNGKAIIGDSTSTTDGVLVLDSPDKAMVLPIVSNFAAIKNPSPGMMAFLQGLTAADHRLIIFNGQKWTFWKP
jgi:hypothetical protein